LAKRKMEYVKKDIDMGIFLTHDGYLIPR